MVKKFVNVSTIAILGIALLGGCSAIREKNTKFSGNKKTESTKLDASNSSVFDASEPPKTKNKELDDEIKTLGLQYDEITKRANDFVKNPNTFSQEEQIKFMQDQTTLLTTMNSVTEKLNTLEDQKNIDSSTYMKVMNFIQKKNADLLLAVDKWPKDIQNKVSKNDTTESKKDTEPVKKYNDNEAQDLQKQVELSEVENQDTTPINPNYSQWLTNYSFYYPRGDQKQSGLFIEPNGNVVQTNSDGTHFSGHASITDAGGSVLSYDIVNYNGTDKPNTKQITPNVQITITWDNNGGTDVYYGYISYSNHLVLTDGIAVNDGVKEVWIAL